MLSEEDKQRIRDEEIFRAAVQKSLSQEKVPQTVRKKLWTFLNTSFGIWILSTIVIGLFGWSYGLWQEARQNQAQIYKLDIEIESRLDTARRNIAFRGFGENKPPYYAANVLLLPPLNEGMTYPEYASRNLRSLLLELMGRVPIAEHGDIITSISEVQLMESEYLNKQLTVQETLAFEEKAANIHKSRWEFDKMLVRNLAPYKDDLILKYQLRRIAGILVIALLVSLLYPTWRFLISGRKQPVAVPTTDTDNDGKEQLESTKPAVAEEIRPKS